MLLILGRPSSSRAARTLPQLMDWLCSFRSLGVAQPPTFKPEYGIFSNEAKAGNISVKNTWFNEFFKNSYLWYWFRKEAGPEKAAGSGLSSTGQELPKKILEFTNCLVWNRAQTKLLKRIHHKTVWRDWKLHFNKLKSFSYLFSCFTANYGIPDWIGLEKT